MLDRIGPATIFKILNLIYKGNQGENKTPLDFSSNLNIENFDFESLLSLNESIFQNLFRLPETIANNIVEKLKDLHEAEKEFQLIEQYKINLISIFDEEYPQSLKNIFLPPIFLYTKGAPLNNSKKLAVVGARKSGSYAKNVCNYFIKELVNNDFEIVSGGAAGVDTIAHKATLENNGKTIAVFGCGLLTTYPQENKNLFKEIVEKNGTLVSCFTLKTTPERFNFPARNRIISGLSDGCLVVEAAEKSGAKITAKFAMEQGRSVFAIPGSIFSELSVGCHQVIAEGGKIVFKPEDILEEFGIQTKQEASPKEKILNIFQESPKETINKNLSKEANLILNNLKNPSSIDELSSITEIDLLSLQNELFNLQMEGLIKQNFAGYWEEIK